MGTHAYAGQPLAAFPRERELVPTEGEQYPVFVYGWSKSGFGSHHKIAPFLAKTGTPAVLPGAVMLVNERFPFLLGVGSEADVVVGEMLTLRADAYDLALTRLDFANDIDATDRPHNFRRVLTTVYTFDRRPVPAWVYLAGNRITTALGETPRVVSGWWTPETHREAWDIFTSAIDGDVETVTLMIEAPPSEEPWDVEMV